MDFGYTERQVHNYIYKTGLELLIPSSTELEKALLDSEAAQSEDEDEEASFELWRILKLQALEKISQIHESVRYGSFIGSGIKLPTDGTTPMELDLLGQHEDGLFILELKVERSSERNAFSELLAYSNYIAQTFAMSGPQDITNVLVAPMAAKITRHAFLYDLLIANRNTVAYIPKLLDGKLDSLQLQLHIPSDEDFRQFSNEALSHQAMACVVASFHDRPGFYDSDEVSGQLNNYTSSNLNAVGAYAAQLMESENLHGFTFIRKPWDSIPTYYRNSLIICATNPFHSANPDRLAHIANQLDDDELGEFLESPKFGFTGRLIKIAQQALEDCLTQNVKIEIETPSWSYMSTSMVEVVFTHNFAFRPTGVFRKAYISHINQLHKNDDGNGDLSPIKIRDVMSWLRAWVFMESFDQTDEAGLASPDSAD